MLITNTELLFQSTADFVQNLELVVVGVASSLKRSSLDITTSTEVALRPGALLTGVS